MMSQLVALDVEENFFLTRGTETVKVWTSMNSSIDNRVQKTESITAFGDRKGCQLSRKCDSSGLIQIEL